MKTIGNTRSSRAKLNIIVPLVCQLITLFCGLIVPQLMISSFGSEAYGATASIAQFLAYISLLEGGVGGVARAALYKPLAENNIQVISEIITEIKKFFRVIGYIFIVYVLFLACSFKYISHIQCFDWFATFLLVIVISISTFAQYFIGISYATLIQASQRTYITSIISISTTILNTILIVILVNLGSNLIFVKLVSSCIFVLRPILMWLYVKNKYRLVECKNRTKNYLNQKWAGLGQHIAYFLYSNTDIAVLTVFSNLKVVAVYSVYYMVVSQLENLTASFSSGMEAVFGDMIAKNEIDKLHKTFGYYEIMISIIATILFSTASVLIIPFVRLYTSGINDVNYIQPIFSLLLLLASYVTCVRKPYHNMTIAAGHFRETQIGAYGEAIINIILSIILVIKFGMIGVAVGTFTATVFRLVYYVIYLSNNIFNRKIKLFIKRTIVNVLNLVLIYLLGSILVNVWSFSSYYMWIICGFITALLAVIITLLFNHVFYRNDLNIIFNKYKK